MNKNRDLPERRHDESAPYRFVPLNEAVAPSPVSLENLLHGEIRREHLDATITVDWVPETPFLIGETGRDKNGEFVGPFKLGKEGPFAIPGSTIKGMLRSVMEIICYGRLHQINGHHRYAFRDFMHDDYKGRMTKEDNIQAGWLFWDKKEREWRVQPVKWHKLDIESIANRFGTSANNWVTTRLIDKYRRAKQLLPRKKNVVNFEHIERFSFNCGGKVAVLDSNGNRQGVMVFSGSSPQGNINRRFQKKVEYIFEDLEGVESVRLDPEIFEIFQLNHSKPGKKRIPEGSWKDLQNTLDVKGGMRIPIFYCGDLHEQQPDTFYFGLTRLFKIPYHNSVRDVLNRITAHSLNENKTKQPDIVEALFGFVYEDDEKPDGIDQTAQKGRVAFGFASCDKDAVDIGSETRAVMMGPRASFSPYYLAGKQLDYNDDQSVLAGRKRYPVRYTKDELGAKANDEIKQKLENTLTQGNHENKDIQTRLRYLIPSDTLRFSGEIRLRNVHPVELGALLWAISFGDAEAKSIYRHSMGRGKAFGMGQIRVDNLRLQTEHYNGDQGGSCQEYLSAFKDYMQERYPNWSEYLQEKTFLIISDPEIGSVMRQKGKLNYPGNHQAHRKIKVGRQNDERNHKPNDEPLPERLLVTTRNIGNNR